MKKLIFNNPKKQLFFRIGQETLIKVIPGKFYWKGEEVKDTEEIYKRFNEWLKLAEKNV